MSGLWALKPERGADLFSRGPQKLLAKAL